jgi:hypothetical protein
MTPHPCDGHPCDHCYRCDVLGECCLTVAPGQAVQQPADAACSDRLHAAIVHGAQPPTLAELVQQDARASLLSASVCIGVLSAAPTSDQMSHDSRKEAERVAIPRTL